MKQIRLSMRAQPIDAYTLSKLKWRCRRGMLENDLLIERFFERYSSTLTDAQACALMRLMDISDNELLDLLLGREEPTGKLNTPDMHELLGLLRPH